MLEQSKAYLAYEKLLSQPAPAREKPGAVTEDRQLEVTVIFTGIPATLRALKTAASLAQDLHACIRLLVPQVIPYPLPLENPQVLLEFNERRFRTIASEQPIQTRVEIYLCRDKNVMLADQLRPNSVIVIGGRKRWWRTSESALANRLRKAGHQVVLECMEDRQNA